MGLHRTRVLQARKPVHPALPSEAGRGCGKADQVQEGSGNVAEQITHYTGRRRRRDQRCERAAVRPEMQRCFEQHESANRSEEHTSELQSLMRISYAVFCLKKKQQPNT